MLCYAAGCAVADAAAELVRVGEVTAAAANENTGLRVAAPPSAALLLLTEAEVADSGGAWAGSDGAGAVGSGMAPNGSCSSAMGALAMPPPEAEAPEAAEAAEAEG